MISDGKIVANEIGDQDAFPYCIFPTLSEAREWFGKDAELVKVEITTQ